MKPLGNGIRIASFAVWTSLTVLIFAPVLSQ